MTRLHLIVIVIGVSAAGYWLYQNHSASILSFFAHTPFAQAPASQPTTASGSKSSGTDRAKSVSRKVADLASAYQTLRAGSADIPSILQPLKRAKDALAAGQFDLASTSADEALEAMREYKEDRRVVAVRGQYQVARGDTLWAIARDRSPVQAGAGWVGIWKANKQQIRDFDNVEPGTILMIPQEEKFYVTPYWKPRHFQVARRPGEVDVAELPRVLRADEVDVAELPREDEVILAELPVPEDSDRYAFVVSALRPPPFLPYPQYR